MIKILRAAAAAAPLIALALAGCATPTTQGPQVAAGAVADEAQAQLAYMLKARLAEQERVARVASRLMAANVDVCPAKAWRAGLHVAALGRTDPKLQPVLRAGLGLSEQPSLVFVEPGSPADLAGLKSGDVLLQVGGSVIQPGPKAQSVARGMLNRAAKTQTPFAVEVRRPDGVHDVELHPRQTCDYAVRVEDSEVINAYADGEGIILTRGMLKLAGTDEELAVVLGHEMAHDAEGHLAAQRRNQAAGMAGGLALDILAAAAGVNTGGAFTRAAGQAGGAYASPEFEAEADYVGLYYMARAGYDIGHAEEFWRKMAVEAPGSILVTTSHPAHAKRYVALAAARKEIEAKRAQSLALLPERRKPAAGAPLKTLDGPPTANGLVKTAGK